MSTEITTVRALRDRTRLRVSGPRLDESEAVALTHALAKIQGTTRVEVSRLTGSILCEHPAGMDVERLATCVRETLAARITEEENPPEAPPIGSKLAQVTTEIVRDMNRDILRATDGHLDLGMVATFTFLGAGAAQVAAGKNVSPPPWFNLAWWGFRTFMTTAAEPILRDRRSRKAKEQP